MKTFILFVGSHCPACATMKANMAKAGITYDEAEINSMDGFVKGLAYWITSVPTLAVFIDGKLDSTYVGAYPVSELEKIKGR